MAKEYKVGDKYYLPVTISSIAPGYQYPIELMFADCDERDTTDTVRIADEPELLLTAEDIAMVINTERDDALAELKTRNAELEALLKEVMATRDEAIRQINELLAENSKLKAGADKLKDTLVDRTKDVQHYKEENDRLKKALEERAENVMNLLEENEKLKAERDDLKSQVGKYTADIQDMASEIHFLKADRDKQKAAYDELKGRYDELDSVNHEQAEKIRCLDKTVAKLKDENTNLSFLLEAKPEEETKKTVHVFTNDGTEVEFRRYTAVQYRTDYNILVIKDGEEIVAGFIRGDRPGNLAYWWTE